VGSDDVAVSAFVEPPLTTVRQVPSALDRLAVEVILAGLSGFADDILTVCSVNSSRVSPPQSARDMTRKSA
jgi:DNA-binding LacI/PurR family transcriptional regulator